jgi:hypothetical protein
MSMHPMLALFLRLTVAVALAIVALVILAFLIKVVLAAAVVAALIFVGFLAYNVVRRRSKLPVIR